MSAELTRIACQISYAFDLKRSRQQTGVFESNLWGEDNMTLREEADKIIKEAITKVLPDEAVKQALKNRKPVKGKLYLVAVGKAAWQMANAAANLLNGQIEKGIVITKYGHIQGDIPGIECFEAGHPVPDTNTFAATQKVIELTEELQADDQVLFLLSGGGSALFEKPLISTEELSDITKQLLACGADIVEMNTIRKRLSAVKGGKFAGLCEPAAIFAIVLSDIVGDPLDMIASGPAYADSSTASDAIAIAEKYHLKLSEKARTLLEMETPKAVTNVETRITGSVRNLCLAAKEACEKLGYESMILTDALQCEAKEAGAFLVAIAKTHQNTDKSLAFIAGGETIVHVTGKGLGGRNQELALSAAEGLAACKNTAIFSVGSDGTDGPTDAAGGYCDENTKEKLRRAGMNIYEVLKENDAYHALQKTGGLIITGATGTNVNDVAVVLIRRRFL
jgi:glycerate 2-kinase